MKHMALRALGSFAYCSPRDRQIQFLTPSESNLTPLPVKNLDQHSRPISVFGYRRSPLVTTQPISLYSLLLALKSVADLPLLECRRIERHRQTTPNPFPLCLGSRLLPPLSHLNPQKRRGSGSSSIATISRKA